MSVVVFLLVIVELNTHKTIIRRQIAKIKLNSSLKLITFCMIFCSLYNLNTKFMHPVCCQSVSQYLFIFVFFLFCLKSFFNSKTKFCQGIGVQNIYKKIILIVCPQHHQSLFRYWNATLVKGELLCHVAFLDNNLGGF